MNYKSKGLLIKSDLSRLLKCYKIYAAIIGVSIAILFSTEQIGLINGNILDTYIQGSELSGIMIAYVFCAFPFATVFCEDIDNKYIRYELIRSNLKRYVVTKIAFIYLTAILVMVLGTILFLLSGRIAGGDWVNESVGCMNVLLNGSYSILLKKEHYFLYCVMYSLQLGLLSGLLSVLAGYFSLYIHNRVTVLALPIIIYQILIECSGNTIYTVFIFRAYNRPMNKDWESFSLILLISIIPTILLGCLIYKKIQKRL